MEPVQLVNNTKRNKINIHVKPIFVHIDKNYCPPEYAKIVQISIENLQTGKSACSNSAYQIKFSRATVNVNNAGSTLDPIPIELDVYKIHVVGIR